MQSLDQRRHDQLVRLSDLPVDTIEVILTFLDMSDLPKVFATCSAFSKLAFSDTLWFSLTKLYFGVMIPFLLIN